jgi:hypothetical protein
MMLELKIKALQSLLEKSGETEEQPKKRSKKNVKRKSKLKNRRSASNNSSNKLIETRNEEEFSNPFEMQQTSSKLPSLLSIQTTYPAGNFTNRPNMRLMQASSISNNNNNYYDNYELQDMDMDMDIETNTSLLPNNNNNNINFMKPMSSSSSYLQQNDYQQQQQHQPFTNNFLNDQMNSIYSPDFRASWWTEIGNLMASFRELSQNNFESPAAAAANITPLLSLTPLYQQLLPTTLTPPQLLPTSSLIQQKQQPFARRQNLKKSPFKKKQRNNKYFNKQIQPLVNAHQKLSPSNNIIKTNQELVIPPSTRSAHTSPVINNNKTKSNIPSLMDVDERFLVDSLNGRISNNLTQIQQAANEEKLIEEEKLLREILINSIKKNQEKRLEKQQSASSPPPPRSKQEELEEVKNNEKEEEEEMQQLRLKLLDNLSQKRKEKEQQMDQDFSLLKRKLIEHEQELANNQISETFKKTESNSSFIKQRKINPVIIHLNSAENDQETSSDDDDDDDDDDENDADVVIDGHNNNEGLQQNIGLFLKEAKQQAQIIEPINQIEILPTTSKQESDNEVKKLFVKSLRDKINLNSKEINDLTKKSSELKQIKLKKDKDIELTKQKLTTLREQLIAAEKILNANEAAANLVKLQQKSTDLKLIKLINIKKTQQLQLQKLLLTTTATPPQVPTELNKRIVLPPASTTVIRKTSTPPPPPLPTQPPPPLPPLPPLPPTNSETKKPTTAFNKSDSSEFGISKIALPIQMTLGGVVAATAGLKKKSTFSKYSLSNNNITNNTGDSTITRPNLFTSKQTDKKLEQLAAISNINDQNKLNNNSIVSAKIVDINNKASPFKLRNGNSINNNKKLTSLNNATNTLSINKMKQATKKIETTNNDKLNQCLASLIVSVFIIFFRPVYVIYLKF